jgi:hypothetical protein
MTHIIILANKTTVAREVTPNLNIPGASFMFLDHLPQQWQFLAFPYEKRATVI